MSLRSFVSAALLTASVITCRSLLAEEQIDYLNKIKPVLAGRCYACHGVLKQEAGLRLDTAALAIKGGESGPSIKPGDAESSLLIQRVTAKDESERMPGEGEPLKPEQIDALRAWINQKAPAPANEQPEQDPRNHWAFRPIIRPPVPAVANSSWLRNPIDSFVAQKHEQLGLKPQATAPREVLVRRLYFDLIGLPPSEEELTQIDAETGDGWYEQLVQRLLDDPRYGERWARHWMDIWRYSDWWGLGDELRYSQPHIWHWRDWIVESLNANVHYDEMVRLMLAADELHPNDLDKLRATGFLARNYYLYSRTTWMEETVEHVSKGFLGLTINCAKCHDHKYDPIKQVDYYRMRAFFEPYFVRLDMVPGETDFTRDGIPRVFDGKPDAPTYRYERGQESQPDKSKVISPGVPKVLEFGDLAIHPVTLPKDAWQPERRRWVLESYSKAAQKNIRDAEASVTALGKKLETATKELEQLEISPTANEQKRKLAKGAVGDAQAELHAATLVAELSQVELASIEKRAAAMRAAWAKMDDKTGSSKVAEAARAASAEAVKAERRAAVAKALQVVADIEFRLRRSPAEGKAALEKELSAARESVAKAEQSAAAAPTSGDHFTPLLGATRTRTRHINATKDDPTIEFPDHSTGRRTALADWITNRRNPLTARVAVNHIWARHMGTPLVASVFNFGRKGTAPTNPELLDWLAAEFIDSGWDMKHLHRLIVLSNAYRMSSSAAGADADLAKDPENLHLWRRAPMRLESEAVRDSILAFAGTLDKSRGGPSVLPATQADSTRRSLYFFHSNNDRNVFLTMFDEAAVGECYRRDQSIIPQQALALSNSRLVLDAARRIAEHFSPAGADPKIDDTAFVKKAYYFLLGIRANDDEVRACTKALNNWRNLPSTASKDHGDQVRKYLIWAMFNHNDFVTVR